MAKKLTLLDLSTHVLAIAYLCDTPVWTNQLTAITFETYQWLLTQTKNKVIRQLTQDAKHQSIQLVHGHIVITSVNDEYTFTFIPIPITDKPNELFSNIKDLNQHIKRQLRQPMPKYESDIIAKYMAIFAQL